jgi:hypothetical protein
MVLPVFLKDFSVLLYAIVLKILKIPFHSIPHGVPRGILRVFINVLDENVFQNPQIFRRTHSPFPEQLSLVAAI